jgi:RIO-like serine/threonine protein kinase
MNFEEIPRAEQGLRQWTLPIDFDREADSESEKTTDLIKQLISNPDNFLGSGGAGKVFNLGDQCIKLIINRHGKQNSEMYKLGNSVFEEFDIQTKLNNFSIDGVFSPKTVRFYSGQETNAIVMERLDAANLQLILNGEEKLPECFDLDIFFEKLENYISEMHDEQGIIHLDLEARNIMIDKQTGDPRVIDFGQAKMFVEKDEEFKLLEEKDFKNIDLTYKKVSSYLEKK